MGLAASRQHWDAGLILSPAQWIKDLALPRLWHRMQLWLRSDPCPQNSICSRAAKRYKKNPVVKAQGVRGSCSFALRWSGKAFQGIKHLRIYLKPCDELRHASL